MANGVADDLQRWRASRGSPIADRETLTQLLARLKAWKAEHDADRASQRIPFFVMVWDGIFGDEDSAVCEAIEEIETTLARG